MILIIAATEIEIAPCRAVAGCEFVVSGMGATNAAIATVRAIQRFAPTLVVQVGIAGATDKTIAIGEVVFVTSDYQADLGAWRNDSFTKFESERFSIENRTSLRSVAARSVNTACVTYVNDDAQIESMEGAAFMQAAATCGTPCVEIRSISNYTDSPRGEWQIERAIAALPAALDEIIKQYR